MNSNRLLAWTAIAVASVSAAACANASPPPTPPPQPGFSLTIYSNADPATFDPQEIVRQQTFNPYYLQQNPLPGYGIVRENREIKLDEGDNTVRFTDVATGIDPTTVSFQSLTAPDAAAVLEQNYEYDLVSADKLLGKYLGKEIEVIGAARQAARRRRSPALFSRSTHRIWWCRPGPGACKSSPAARKSKASNWPVPTPA